MYLVNRQGERRIDRTGLTGAPFLPNSSATVWSTETAMTKEHAFSAAELCPQAKAMADQHWNKTRYHHPGGTAAIAACSGGLFALGQAARHCRKDYQMPAVP